MSRGFKKADYMPRNSSMSLKITDTYETIVNIIEEKIDEKKKAENIGKITLEYEMPHSILGNPDQSLIRYICGKLIVKLKEADYEVKCREKDKTFVLYISWYQHCDAKSDTVKKYEKELKRAMRE